jgi:hypothetical protein
LKLTEKRYGELYKQKVLDRTWNSPVRHVFNWHRHVVGRRLDRHKGVEVNASWLPVLLFPICIETMANQERSSVAGQAADVATTAAGVAQGAAELNPLGPVGAILIKPIVYAAIKAQPKEDQPKLFSIFGTAGWAAAANNACIIASGGLCWLVGIVAGFVSWQAGAAEREYWELCKRVKHREPKEMEC